MFEYSLTDGHKPYQTDGRIGRLDALTTMLATKDIKIQENFWIKKPNVNHGL
jgi:hypothetical protein